MQIEYLPLILIISFSFSVYAILTAGLLFVNSKLSNTDEDDEPRCVQLTNQHKTAIRFIRKVNYSEQIAIFLFVGRRPILFCSQQSNRRKFCANEGDMMMRSIKPDSKRKWKKEKEKEKKV